MSLLDVRIAGRPGRILLLENIEKGAGRPPRGWRICKDYEQLEQEGLVCEVEQPNILIRQWALTEAGRAALDEKERTG